MLITPRFRHFSLYLMIGSTLGVIVSFVVSTGFLFLSGAFLNILGFKNWPALGALIMLFGYVGGIGVGGLIGIVSGLIIAQKLNHFIGWPKQEF